MSEKKTGSQTASKASGVLRDGRTADDSKSAAGSALSQVNPGRSTSDDAAESASKTLSSNDTSDKSKSAAASALSQKEKDD